ncbi:hypothetical protein [Candidatus Frankia alpina]|uniref:Uncharacterized protein n=1 Tax=Candidatus Frankia alpina TaxID=2699483 RepID=A0A4S5EUA3_9ACTN|nr:hypothetical protein [Candidatus Frankia alpina]THJ76074.1 hypothetical protein E7Y31_01810 [Candidatus Frankia alpina]
MTSKAGVPDSALNDLFHPPSRRPTPPAPTPRVQPDETPGEAEKRGERTEQPPAVTAPSLRGQSDGTATSPRRRTPPGRHKLTTYLPQQLYDWIAAEVGAAQDDGHPASIADVVRYALEHVRADPEQAADLRRILRSR